MTAGVAFPSVRHASGFRVFEVAAPTTFLLPRRGDLPEMECLGDWDSKFATESGENQPEREAKWPKARLLGDGGESCEKKTRTPWLRISLSNFSLEIPG